MSNAESQTPVSDFIEQSPNFKAVEKERDYWQAQFEETAESAGATIKELRMKVTELVGELDWQKMKVREAEKVKRDRAIDRAKLVNGIETAIKLHESDLNPDLAFELMSTLLKGLLREVGEE